MAPLISTSAPDADEWSTSHASCCTSGEITLTPTGWALDTVLLSKWFSVYLGFAGHFRVYVYHFHRLYLRHLPLSTPLLPPPPLISTYDWYDWYGWFNNMCYDVMWLVVRIITFSIILFAYVFQELSCVVNVSDIYYVGSR